MGGGEGGRCMGTLVPTAQDRGPGRRGRDREGGLAGAAGAAGASAGASTGYPDPEAKCHEALASDPGSEAP